MVAADRLAVERVELDLDRLGVLVRPLAPEVRVAGRVSLGALTVQGRLSGLTAGQLPRARGELLLGGVGLRLARSIP